MSSSESYSITILNNITLYLYRYGNLLIYIIGNTGNTLSAYIFFKKSWRKNVCVFYFLICLFLNSIYLNSTIIGTCLSQGFSINIPSRNMILCKIYFYTIMVASTLLPSILILASIDRLLISSEKVNIRLYSSKRLAYLSISISSFIWIIFNIHILIKVNIRQINSFYSICYYDNSKFYINFVNYFLTVINCTFCFLMIILSIFSLKNVRYVKFIRHQQRKQIRPMTKKDFQLLRCLFVQNMFYISVSLGSSLFSIYKTITMDQKGTLLQDAIISFIGNILTFIYFTYYSSNFFIFFNVSKAFRQELKRIVNKIFGQHLLPVREEENIEKDNVELNIINTNVSSNRI